MLTYIVFCFLYNQEMLCFWFVKLHAINGNGVCELVTLSFEVFSAKSVFSEARTHWIHTRRNVYWIGSRERVGARLPARTFIQTETLIEISARAAPATRGGLELSYLRTVLPASAWNMSFNRAHQSTSASANSESMVTPTTNLLRRQKSFAVESNPNGSGENRAAVSGGRLSARAPLRKQVSVDRAAAPQRERFALHRQHSLVAAQRTTVGHGDGYANADGDSELRIFAAISQRRPSADEGIECVIWISSCNIYRYSLRFYVLYYSRLYSV